ncbi:lytic transglycosylase domain-containing protein [Phaeocystidibacter luteus]|nr:lytic transglycosylase domain-containing protein [Phaeocystidibacter luteus]
MIIHIFEKKKDFMQMNIRNQHIILGALFLTLTAGTPHNGDGGTNHSTGFTEDYRIHALSIPTDLTLGGESIPLNDPEVYERLDRELLVNTYWQSNTLLMIKRAHRWVPKFEAIFEAEGVPSDLVYLGLIESGYQNVVSPAGAAGYWQFLESTGKEYGLIIDNEVDERYHPEKAALAAAKYLKDAKEEFGSWTLAAASYNMGKAGVSRQLERQGVDDYYDLLLNSETARYVFRIVAVKEIVSNPAKYGFLLDEEDYYPQIQTTTVEIDSAIASFPEFATDLGINYKTLKYHNPWLREAYLKNKNKRTYLIEVPVDKSFISEEE